MNHLFVKEKIKSTLFVILMLSVSILSGCVSDDGTIIIGNENENNNDGNETIDNNTGNETIDNNTGNETIDNNTGNETSNNTSEYNPCEGKPCGEPCTLCDPNDPNCFETEEVKVCNLNGQCVSETGTECGNENGDDTIDTDNDGYTDWCEDFWGTDPNVPNDFPHQEQTCDENGDGIPDSWADGHELNDTDNDGLTNLEEFWNGTIQTNPDTDGDGMPDGWEVVHGLDPLNPADADMDPDMDNLTNLEEFTHGWQIETNGTNPNDPDTDGDGENDDTDIFPADPNNGQFTDTDQDGYNDSLEINCQSNPLDFNSIPQDTDGDGICDPLDPVNDLITMWGNNSAHFLYVKPDLIANSNIENARPYQIEFSANPMAEQNPVVLAHICDKEQGHVADVWSAFVLGPFPYDIISWNIYNTNGQSIGMFVSRDNLTQSDNMTFPTVISTQDVENQSSGHLEADVIDLQYYTCEFDYTDTDGDGVLDWMDAFPEDECATTDTDGDGFPDNILDGVNDPIPNCQTDLLEDDDDDGDTCLDYMDWAPLNSTECFDTDGDGIGDNNDTTPWISNNGNGTFTMNYTMIGIETGHTLYWLGSNYHAYYYSTSPDMVWNDGPKAQVYSHDYMPNVDAVLALMGLMIEHINISTYPVDLGTDTQNVEWGYDDITNIEWRALSSNISIVYVNDVPIFSINASLMLYLDYSDTISSWGEDPVTMWGNSSFSPITSMLDANDPWIYHHLFNAYFEDFGGRNINYSFTSQDAIITTDYSFDNNDNNLTGWLSSLVAEGGTVVGGLFDTVVSEVNVEPTQTGITMSKTKNYSSNQMEVLSQRIKEDEDPYFNN